MTKFSTKAVWVLGLIAVIAQAVIAVVNGAQAGGLTTTNILLGISAVVTAIAGYLTNNAVHNAGQRALEATPPKRYADR